MTDLPRLTTFGWVPERARGFVRDVRCRWAFEEVGQPYELHLIGDAKSPEHRRLQPFGQVPVYQDEDGPIFETGAIVLRIAERAGRLLPDDPGARGRARQWLFAALNTVEPVLFELMVCTMLEGDRPWADERRAIVTGYIGQRLGDLQAHLGDRTWLDGDEFTIGDLMMVSSLGMLRETGMMEDFPALAAYVARGEDRPAHRKAMADHLSVFEHPAAA